MNSTNPEHVVHECAATGTDLDELHRFGHVFSVDTLENQPFVNKPHSN